MHLPRRKSLSALDRGDLLFLVGLGVTGALLVTGLLLPAFTNDRLFQDTQSVSILGAAVKLGDFVDLDFLLGFWCILAVAPLAMLDGWLFERDIRFGDA